MVERAGRGLGLQVGRGSALRRFLDRFRRTSGVPAAASDDLGVELAPLFALLDAIDAEAAEVRGERSARAELGKASEEVEVILTGGGDQAEAEWAEAAKAARRAAGADVRRIVATGEAEAARIRARGRERIPALAADVVRRIQEFPDQAP